MRNSFTFYRSFMDGLENIPPEAFKRVVMSMAHYAMDETLPELDGLENALFIAWQANIDASNKRKDNGLKGGRPRTEKVEIETEKNRTETEPKPKKTETDSLYKYKREIEREKENKKNMPPSVEDVSEYCRERNNGVDAQQFFDFYQSKGWKTGSSAMKDWRAAVRTWERRKPKPSNSFVRTERHDYDMDKLEKEILGE